MKLMGNEIKYTLSNRDIARIVTLFCEENNLKIVKSDGEAFFFNDKIVESDNSIVDYILSYNEGESSILEVVRDGLDHSVWNYFRLRGLRFDKKLNFVDIALSCPEVKMILRATPWEETYSKLIKKDSRIIRNAPVNQRFSKHHGCVRIDLSEVLKDEK